MKNYFITFIFILFFIFITPISIAAATPESYGLTKIDGSNESIQKALNDPLEQNIVFEYNGSIYKGRAQSAFFFLKADNPNIIHPGTQKPWNKVESNGDKADAIAFAQNVSSVRKTSCNMMNNTAKEALYFTQEEADLYYKYIKYLEPFICTIIFMFWIKGIAEMMATQQWNMQQLGKTVVWVFVALIFLQNIQSIINYLFALSNTLLAKMNISDDLHRAVINQQELISMALSCDTDNQKESWNLVSSSVYNMYFGSTGAGLTITGSSVMMYSRKLSIAVRTVLLPLGFASFAYKGKHSHAVKYLASYLGDILLAFIYILLLSFTSYLQAGFDSGSTSVLNILDAFILPFASMTLMLSCRAIAKEVGALIHA